MTSERKLKHLEFTQAIISRMSGNSFLLKGWSVTLVAALFALAAKDANKNYVVVAYFPVLVFWIIDAYFLSQERLFRDLYNNVRKQKDDEIDFSMDTRPFLKLGNSWGAALFSRTLALFYLSLVAIMLGIMHFIR
ncbi:MAG TPA: hypothetical protein VNX26_02085 [Candidatus Acidoferrum sp.]|jgi:hypothetical protein|nr:hypothetical protein [Candidatus Acidoferrum sp.]